MSSDRRVAVDESVRERRMSNRFRSGIFMGLRRANDNLFSWGLVFSEFSIVDGEGIYSFLFCISGENGLIIISVLRQRPN
ncbi:MAG: hypothetical protein N3G21_11345 [Candidatus Hydrogenedentes bacterium]|nr:hypothetical protein [Candidatus Hydrogenedentota bacterium]